jgi:hypothetical protein
MAEFERPGTMRDDEIGGVDAQVLDGDASLTA